MYTTCVEEVGQVTHQCCEIYKEKCVSIHHGHVFVEGITGLYLKGKKKKKALICSQELRQWFFFPTDINISIQMQQCVSRIYSPVIGETLSLIFCIYWETAWHSKSWICCLSWQLPAWSWHKPKMQDWPQSWWGVGLHSSLCGAHLTQASPPRPWQLGVVWQCRVRERVNVVEQKLLHRVVVHHRRYFTYCCLQKQGIRSVTLFPIKKKSCSCIDLVLVRAVSLSRVSTCRNVPSVGQSQTDAHWNAVQTWKLNASQTLSNTLLQWLLGEAVLRHNKEAPDWSKLLFGLRLLLHDSSMEMSVKRKQEVPKTKTICQKIKQIKTTLSSLLLEG